MTNNPPEANALVRALVLLAMFAGTAHAQKPRVLVLPLPAQTAVDPEVARAFDARLLVALEDTRRVTTVTLEDELECTTAKCIADAGASVQARSVLSVSVVRESNGLTLFATLLDTQTGSASRRAELVRLSAADLATTAPTEITRRLVGAAPGPAVVGIVERGRPSTAGRAISARLAALRAFTVVPADRAGTALTHRAHVTVSELSIVRRRHHVRHYLDGVLVGTLSIADVSDNRVVFTSTVKVTASRRARYSSEAEIAALLVEAAAQDWMTAFHAARTETLLKGDSR